MEEKLVSIPVRTALMPLYYKDFHCLAAACRDNCCCEDWEISFSKKDYLRVKRAAKSEKLQSILSNGMSRLREKEHDGFYARFNVGAAGVCAFQTEEGLCLLQQECGEEALPKVCRSYPRRIVYTPAAREYSLSPSCEGVLALLWEYPEGIDFWEEPLPKQEWQTVRTTPQIARFADIRSFCIDVIQERSLPLSRRMTLLGVFLHRLTELDWNIENTAEDWLAQCMEQLHVPLTEILEQLPRDRSVFLTENIYVLCDLYMTARAKGKEFYGSLFPALGVKKFTDINSFRQFKIDTDQYQQLENQLEGLLGYSDYFFENLMVTAVFYTTFPDPSSPEGLWRAYVNLCSLYGFYRFAAVCGCWQEVSRERLFQVIGQVNRDLLHDGPHRQRLLNQLLDRGGGTLARTAILTGG